MRSPKNLEVVQQVRPKYVGVGQPEMPPVVAPTPERASGLAAPGLLAWLLICKFADALPFYRQEAIFRERHRVFITRQQMVQWMKQGIWLLEGIYRCLQAQLQASHYVQLDGTPIDYLDPGKGRCSQGYLWTREVPVSVWCSNGTPAGRPSVWRRCWGHRFGEKSSASYGAYPAFAKLDSRPKEVRRACAIRLSSPPSLNTATDLASARRSLFYFQLPTS